MLILAPVNIRFVSEHRHKSECLHSVAGKSVLVMLCACWKHVTNLLLEAVISRAYQQGPVREEITTPAHIAAQELE